MSSSDPSISHLTGPTNATLSHEDEHIEHIEPMSAGWTTDYIMHVKLDSKDGTDIPLYNENLSYFGLGIMRQHGDQSEYFNIEQEDYWLFYAHLHDAEMEIIIGGETPILVNSKPGWNNITDKEGHNLLSDWYRTGQLRSGPTWMRSKISYTVEEADGEFDRFVAVRCPKMNNPAVSVRVKGNYGGLHWVGLFVKTTNDNRNEFGAVRTTHRLLPNYAQRTIKYPKHKEWFHWDGAVDLLDRTLTLYPKQLYTTTGSLPALYDKFVTTDPDNEIGQKHFELASHSSSARHFKYVWHATGKTVLKCATYFHGYPILSYMPQKPPLNYVSGVGLAQEPVSPKGGGWNILLTLLGGTTQILTGIFTGNVVGIAAGALKLTDVFNEDKMNKEADYKGFVTAVSEGIKKCREAPNTKPTAAMTVGMSKGEEDIEILNTADIPAVSENIRHGKVVARDFGNAAAYPGEQQGLQRSPLSWSEVSLATRILGYDENDLLCAVF